MENMALVAHYVSAFTKEVESGLKKGFFEGVLKLDQKIPVAKQAELIHLIADQLKDNLNNDIGYIVQKSVIVYRNRSWCINVKVGVYDF